MIVNDFKTETKQIAQLYIHGRTPSGRIAFDMIKSTSSNKIIEQATINTKGFFCLNTDDNQINQALTLFPNEIFFTKGSLYSSDYILKITPDGITKRNTTENDCFTANGGTYDLTQKLDVSARITEADIDAIFK